MITSTFVSNEHRIPTFTLVADVAEQGLFMHHKLVLTCSRCHLLQRGPLQPQI